MEKTMLGRNISAILATVIDNANIMNAMSYLTENEQVGFAACMLGCEVTKEELPQIPDNDNAEDVTVISVNPIKDRIRIRYTALAKRDYIEGGWKWIKLENPIVKEEDVSYDKYMNMADTGIEKM